MTIRILTLLGVLLSSAVAPSIAHAARWWGYAIPVACGEAMDGNSTVVPGTYRTAITVINMSRTDARFRARAMLTIPDPAASLPVRRTIAAISAATIDCGDLKHLFDFEPPLEGAAFRQGVILVQSRSPLEIQVQTTVLGETGGPSISQQTITGERHGRPNRWNRDDDDDSVELCHIPPGNPSKAHTIVVDEGSVPAHQGHGDYLGACED